MTFAVSRGVEALIAPGCRAPWQSVHVDERSRFASQCFALRNSHVTLAQLHISRNDVSRKTCFNGRINDHSHDTQSSSMCRAVTEGSKIRVGDYSKKMERIARDRKCTGEAGEYLSRNIFPGSARACRGQKERR